MQIILYYLKLIGLYTCVLHGISAFRVCLLGLCCPHDEFQNLNVFQSEQGKDSSQLLTCLWQSALGILANNSSRLW